MARFDKQVFFAALLLLTISSCISEIDKATSIASDASKIKTFYATTECSEPDTKVYADANMKVLWNADDRLSVFNKTTYNYQFRFAGEDGDNAGDFELIEPSGLVSGNALSNIYAVYPYSSTNKIDNAGTTITLTLPAEQSYKEHSFGVGANTMIAATNNYFLAFKNVGGYLSLRLYGDNVSVSRITLQGNNHEKIAGKAEIAVGVGTAPSVTMTNEATETVSIVCDPPVQLGTSSSDYTDFWFVIPPITFTQGFTVTVTDNLGGTFKVSTSKSFTISRSTVEWMSPLKVVPVYYQAVDLGLSVKWASFNVGASNPWEVGDYFAWGETTPKGNYSWSTYKWCNGSKTTLTKYNSISEFGSVDNRTCLELSDDAARANWGGKWRMPTHDECNELLDNCTFTSAVEGGRTGYKVTSKINGNSIFLPSEDYGWSSTLDINSPQNAALASSWTHSLWGDRCSGYPIRPVYGDPVSVSDVQLDKSQLTLDLEGGSAQLIATVSPENAFEKGVQWISSSSSIASVDSRGIITAKQEGSAIITVTTIDGGKKAQCAVTVKRITHEFVDLGLSVKWASCNLGASKPEEYGGYYAWGETSSKNDFSWSTYEWGDSYSDYFTNASFSSFRVTVISKYNFSSDHGDVDNKYQLDFTDDPARVNWGDKWRLPTASEFNELLANCSVLRITQGGVDGFKLTSRLNGNSIFLPESGYKWDTYLGSGACYWSSSLSADAPTNASRCLFGNNSGSVSTDYRSNGASVRPVYGDLVPVSGISLDIAKLSLNGGGKTTLTATVYPSNASDKRVLWSSSNYSVASVDANGMVITKQSGSAIITATTLDGNISVQCEINVVSPIVYEAVDLGLSVKWATFNIGATRPEEPGDYFAWGETLPKRNYCWQTYKWFDWSNRSISKYNYIDNKTQLELSDDAARVNWGANWRIPTKEEFDELIENCTYEWGYQNGVCGFIVTSKKNGNKLFFPGTGLMNDDIWCNSYLSGYYRSSTLSNNYYHIATSLEFNSVPYFKTYSTSYDRSFGYTIRPVTE